MKELFKKTSATIASLIFFCLGISSNSHSVANHIEEPAAGAGISKELVFNTKLSDFITGSASIVYPDPLHDPAASEDINDWTPDNYRHKSPLSLNNFYAEFGEDNFTGGAGFKVFQEREGLVSALKDIEYQFFPVDATNPLKMKGISVPGIWGKYYFNPDTYIKLVGYDTQWSKISPETVPDLKRMKLGNPKGHQGYGLFTTLGTKFDDTDFEVGFTRGWGSWPSEEREPESKFSPNPYRVSAVFIKAFRNFDSWRLGSTALVKHADEKAGSVYNMLFSVDKNLSLWGTPVSVGGSYFYVQSFEQSRHLRTSPWEDLGNSFSVRAAIEDQKRQIRHGVEGIINHEEKGFYFMGQSEKQVTNSIKIGSQMNFFYDGQKYISNEYDRIRVSGYVTYSF